MARLPVHGETNWGTLLNEFLLVGHTPEGTVRNRFDIVNVRDYGATGLSDQPSIEVTSAIQRAHAAGAHLYFPSGEYSFDRLTFDQDYQQITFAPDVILKPASAQSQLTFSGNNQIIEQLRVHIPRDVSTGGQDLDQFEWLDGLIHFSGSNNVIRNLIITADGFAWRLVNVSKAANCKFEDIQIVSPNVMEGIYIENTVKCIFLGGEIKGNRRDGSIGLKLGADKGIDDVTQYGNTSVFAPKAIGLTIHHWDVGVLFSGPTHDDPAFYSCMFDNTPTAAIRIEPEFHPEQQNNFQGGLLNLMLSSCHFEGSRDNIFVSEQGVIKGGIIAGCRFGRLTKRVINAPGVLIGMVVSGCYFSTRYADANLFPDGYEFAEDGSDRCTDDPTQKELFAHIWEVGRAAVHCLDLFNNWESLPDCNFSIGNRGHHVVRLNGFTNEGRTLDIHSDMAHHGDRLGFFGITPVTRSTELYTPLDPNSATPNTIATALNQLTDDLARLGLINKSNAVETS